MATSKVDIEVSASGAEAAAAKLADVGRAGDEAMKKVGQSSNDAASGGLLALEKASDIAKDKVKELASESGNLGKILAAMGPEGLIAAAGIGTIVAVYKEATEAADALARRMRVISAEIKATGDASGQTAEGIEALSRQIATNSKMTMQDVQQTATQLLTFRGITADVFDQTIKAAANMATVFGTDMPSAATKLARAMEDPAHGLDQLRRSGIVLTDQVKEQIIALHDQGDAYAANKLLLAELDARMQGTAEAGASTWHTFGQEMEIFWENLGHGKSVVKEIVAELNKQFDAVNNLSEAQLELFNYKDLTHHRQDLLDEIAKEITERRELNNVAADEGQAAQARMAVDEMGAKAKKDINAELEAQVSLSMADVKASLEATDAAARANDRRVEMIKEQTAQADGAERLLVAYVKGAEAFKQTKIDLEVETALRKLGAGATDAQRAAVEALARSEATAKATTKDLQDQDAQYAKDKEKSAQLEEKRLNEAEKRAEKVAHEMANAIASESQKASTAVVDAFFDGFDSIKNYAIKTAKEIAAAMLIRPIIQPIIAGAIGSLTGGVGGGGGALGGVANGASLGSAAYTLGGGSAGVFGGIGAGVGNYIDTLGANYLGTGAAANSVPLSQLGTANLTGATLSSLLGGAAIGGLAGNLLVGLWGGNKTVGTIGGAATGVSAAALGLTNPITGVLAALTILGSLFGNKPSDKTAESNLDLGSGAISAVPGVGDKFDQGNLDRANALTGTVGNFTNFFQSFGAKAQGRVFFDVGSRDGIRAAVGGDQARFGADDAGAAAAISFVVKKIAAQMGDQLPKELQTALDHVDFSSTAAISKSLDQLAVIKQFLDLQKEIAGQAEPMSQAETVYRNTHTQIEALAEQVKALGISADEANGLIDTFDATFRTKYTKDMTATLNEVTGRGFLNQIQGALDEHKTNVHDAGVFGTDVGIADKIEGGRLASILGGLTSDQLAVVQQMFANVPEVVAALGRASGALAATAAAATTAAAAQTAQATALADMNAAYDKRLSDLDDETRALQSTASAWASVNAQMQAFSAGLLIDPSLSPLGLGDQVTEAKRQLQDTYAKAQGGDVNAAAAFPDLARRFLQLDKQYDTTSAAYAQNFAMVQSMASQIQSTAGAQVSVASQQLTVLGQIRDALVAQRGAINGGTAAATRPATTAADANALNQLYNAARGSQTDAAFLSGPSGASWIAARDQSIAGQTDANYLLSVLPAARSQQTTPGLEAVGSSFEAAIASRLRELGVPVPAYADGGPIMRTGLAYVHAGEHVSSQADMSTLNAKLDRLCGLFEGMISGSMTAAEVHAAHLEAIADNTAKTANAPYDTAVLAAAAGRSRVLK